jgi:hypothetical protein
MKTIGLLLLLLTFSTLNAHDSASAAPYTHSNNAKFIYAELVFQRNYGENKLWVSSNYVSQQTKQLIATKKYADEGLEILGQDDWELTTAVTREFNGGFEIYYYLKKKVG